MKANDPDNPYRRSGHRFSLLPVTRYCGFASTLTVGSGREAVIGAVGHAVLSGEASERDLERLTPQEKAEVLKWKAPWVCTPEGDILDYSIADKEVPLGLDEFGCYVDPLKSDCLTRGDMDCGWVVETESGKIAFVLEIKRSAWTAHDAAESLQLAAQGLAYAQREGCFAFMPGIWPSEGSHIWGEWVTLDSPEARELWQRIYYAATTPVQEPIRGPYCRTHCWGRLGCKAHVQSTALWLNLVHDPQASGGLAPVVLPLSQELPDFIKSARELLDAVEDTLKVQVERGELEITDADGRTWGPVRSRGREYVDREALERELGDEARKFIKRGEPSTRFQWRKSR